MMTVWENDGGNWLKIAVITCAMDWYITRLICRFDVDVFVALMIDFFIFKEALSHAQGPFRCIPSASAFHFATTHGVSLIQWVKASYAFPSLPHSGISMISPDWMCTSNHTMGLLPVRHISRYLRRGVC